MNVDTLLRKSGLRPTSARRTILALLADRERPLLHSEITSDTNMGKFNRVTIYRTLNVLEKAGLIHRVLGTDGTWRFCYHSTNKCGCPGGHPHFLCRKCGRMFCLKSDLPRVEVPDGFVVDGKQLVVYGLCPNCSEGKEGTSSEKEI